MKLYTGIDLHSNNGYYAIVDESGKRLKGKRICNHLDHILNFLVTYRSDLKTIAVESTYNWYWLVDGLQENGYNVVLANPAKMEQYDGLKEANDKTDAFWIAEMLRLDILPTGYIYPKEERQVRDILRRRMLLVQQRTAQILSLQSTIERQTGKFFNLRQLSRMKKEDLEELLNPYDDLVFICRRFMDMISFLSQNILQIEKRISKKVSIKPQFEKLLTMPGIGNILGLTIMLETGDIGRFEKAGDYTSYCRCVQASRKSNGKKKGENNSKNGNKYLSWAFVEAVHHGIRVCKNANSFYQRKKVKSNNGALATKALASKYSKGAYYILKDQIEFNVQKMFG